jgi:hypothetical protein
VAKNNGRIAVRPYGWGVAPQRIEIIFPVNTALPFDKLVLEYGSKGF